MEPNCCGCTRKSKCLKCICSGTGCTNCSSPICQFKRVREEEAHPSMTVKRPRISVQEVDDQQDPVTLQNKKDIIKSMTEEQAKQTLEEMMKRDPLAFDDVIFGEDGRNMRRPDWCQCDFCFEMETERMNVCCNEDTCITKSSTFKNLCLDTMVVEIAGVLNYCDHFHDKPSFDPKHYRNQAYRFYVLWQHGKLGRGNCVCPPACVVSAIRKKFPAPDGNYIGYDSADDN